MKEKFVLKWMRHAKLMGEDDNPCHSRKIGVLIVDPISNTISGTGYNGPAPSVPHCDTEESLRNFFWPQLSENEKRLVTKGMPAIFVKDDGNSYDSKMLDYVIQTYANTAICPRRLVKAGAGERSELCSCGHAERHAITNSKGCYGHYMFCYCGLPCIQCTDAIIQAGIKRVYYLNDPDYHKTAKWMMDQAGIETIILERGIFE